MTQEYAPLNKALITRGKKMLKNRALVIRGRKMWNTDVDVLSCHKCGVTLKEGNLIHKQRVHLYCAACWARAYLDVEDEE